MNVLEFDSLYLQFGSHRVLASVHMICRTGRVVGLLGRNGSGKSCLMRVVFGTLSAEFKSVRFNGVTLAGDYARGNVIAYLPQDELIPSFIKLKEALDLFEIEETKMERIFPLWPKVKDCRAEELSGGQRRMVEVFIILQAAHPFCILDEPFSGLSPLQIEILTAELNRAKEKKGIIITDHLHRHVRDIADDLYVLTNGQTRKVVEEEQLVEWGYLNEV